jgi:MYXO-CTERM domain-containing protein
LKTLSSVVVLLCATFLYADTARAHIALLEPTARYDGAVNNQNKACPCGVGESNRLCDVDGDRSDPDRSNNVTTLEAGSTVTIQWEEYVGHTGRYRVAFDSDGADYADFNENVLADLVDPPGSDGNTGDGAIWEVEITVPDTPCDNCTLQLIQRMDGDTVTPVGETIGLSSYYACADVTIVPAGSDVGNSEPDMGPEPEMDMGTGETDMGTTPTPSDMGSTTQPGTDTGQNSGDPDAGSAFDDVSATGGCGCGVARSAPGSAFLLLGMMVFGFRRRRRRPSA